jgi:hypothetical protein
MRMTQPDLVLDRFCAGCGYDLRGIGSDRCPECGLTFDPNQPTEPQIPWCHRKTLGKFDAFWRTVHLATFRTAKLAGEINRPVSLADALSFRRAVTRWAFFPAACAGAFGYLTMFDMFDMPWHANDHLGSAIQWIGLPVALTSLWFFLLFVFGMLSYFFHPANLPVKQQNRAVALSYYACAPWAYLFIVPLATGVIALAAWFWQLHGNQGLFAMALATIVSAVPVIVWGVAVWFVPLRMLERTTHCGRLKTAVVGFVVRPIGFVLCAVLTVGVLNAVYWFVALVIYSFT